VFVGGAGAIVTLARDYLGFAGLRHSQALIPLVDNVLHSSGGQRDFALETHRRPGHRNGGRNVRIYAEHGSYGTPDRFTASSIRIGTTSGMRRGGQRVSKVRERASDFGVTNGVTYNLVLVRRLERRLRGSGLCSGLTLDWLWLWLWI